MGLDGCFRVAELSGMFFTNGCYINNKKGDYKMCTSQRAFKDTLHCVHIPLKVVPKGAQPLAQLESPGRGRDSLAKRTQGVVGWERWRKEKAAFQLKMSPQFKGQLRAGWPQRRPGEGGAAAGRTGVFCISFRSSRVWSSILCVQRCSSLVHFRLSSKSLIVLATDLSANSARVSASLSLSVRIFISSSYVSSFRGYFTSAALRHFRFWSISLICSSVSRQRVSASSARPSVRSKSPSIITNLRATSSYFFSASSAMCLASLSWIS